MFETESFTLSNVIIHAKCVTNKPLSGRFKQVKTVITVICVSEYLLFT